MIFYYFLPNLTVEQVREGDFLRAGVLEAAGLAEILADVKRVPQHASVSFVRSPAGPGGQAGTVITPVSKGRGVPELIGNDPAKQKWVQGSGFGVQGSGKPAYWVGSLIGEPPTPLDLERLSIVAGHGVADPGGYEWKAPIARAPRWDQPYGFLPQSFTFGADGEPVSHLDPRWEWLWQLAGEIRDWYIGLAGPPDDAPPAEQATHTAPPFTVLVKHAARILGVNYRVGPQELSLLHELGRPVLTQATIHEICKACYGWQIEDEAKKNETPSGTSDSSAPEAPSSSP
jgi:hypothetical protein